MQEPTISLLNYIIGAGGVVTAIGTFLTYKLGLKKLRREHQAEIEKAQSEQYEKFVSRLLAENERMDQKVTLLENKIEAVMDELKESQAREEKTSQELHWLQQQFTIMEAADEESPLPYLFIDPSWRVRAHNEAFNELFAKPHGYVSNDYLEKHISEVLPQELSDELCNNIIKRAKYRPGDLVISMKPIPVFDKRIADSWRLYFWPKYVNKLLLGYNVQAVPNIS